MKSVTCFRHGGPEVLELVEVDTPRPQRNEVLIRVEMIGVNFTDVVHRKGTALRQPVAFPFTPGVEVAGEVAEVGEAVQGVAVGAKAMAIVPRGGYAEYVAAPAPFVIPLPAGITMQQAAALPVQGLAAYHTVLTLGRLAKGERILIEAAAGGVGTIAVQLAKALGAGQVIAVASSRAKLDLALSLGADVGIDYAQPDWRPRVVEATEGRGVDLFLDSVGGARFSENFACLAPFGRIVSFGAASGERAVIDSERLSSGCYSVSGYYTACAASQPGLIGPPIGELVRHLLAKQIELQISAELAMADAAEAHRRMENRETTGKLLLVPETRP